MKIQIEIDSKIKDYEVIIRCSELNEDVQNLKRIITDITTNKEQLVFYQKEKEYYFPVEQIIFFETADNSIYAHTVDNLFQVRYKLYELESLLPSYFMRISKSTILNTREVYSITKSLTSSSTVEFQHTHKKVFVSRNYYKALKYKLDQK